jgi:broad specificity phosphatase PhoE
MASLADLYPGECDGLTAQEIQERNPGEWGLMTADPYRHRYPGRGEVRIFASFFFEKRRNEG